MDNNKIVHFVGFITNLHPDDFTPLWEACMKTTKGPSPNITLEETTQKQKGIFKYVSRHECKTADFNFTFMKEGGSANFPERKARVVQAGGYLLNKPYPQMNKIKDDIKIMAFLPHSEADLDFYHRQSFHQLNIYEAYFENCTYSYVMEFFLPEEDAQVLLAQLKTRPGTEAALYKVCDMAAIF